MKKKIIFIIAVSFFVSNQGLAAPSISEVSGIVSHSQNITVSGFDFGNKNPVSPLWWDNSEEANLNNPSIMRTGEIPSAISTLTGSNKHYSDAWPHSTQNQSTRMQYRQSGHRNVSAPHLRSTKFMTGCHDDEGECLGGETGQNVGLTVGDFSRHSTWFVSYYLRLDPLWPVGTTQNYKFFNWEMGNPRSSAYSSPFCYDNTNSCGCGTGSEKRSTPGCNFDFWSGATAVQIISPNCNAIGTPAGFSSPNCGAPFTTHNNLKKNPLKNWVKQEHVFDYDTDKYWFGVDNVEFWDTENQPGCTFNKTTYANPPSGVTVGGFWKENVCGNLQDDLNDDACRYFDDLYIDNTFSRIILADNSNYDLAMIVEPQLPLAWANNSLNLKVNLGKLPDSGTAYLFVFDANNNHNATGYAVILSGNGDAPAIPSGLSVR
jgi:hypothetical protein